jgi:hypothetical protein
MAVVNQLATNLAPLTHPQTAGQVTGQNMEKIQRLITITNGDSIDSIYLLGQLPDTAVVDDIVFEGPASTLTGANDSDVGLYDMNAAAKVTGTGQPDFYGDGIDLTSAGTAGGSNGGATWKGCTNRAPAGVFATGALQIINEQVWQDAGDAEGPQPASGKTLKGAKYQLGLKLQAAATATATFLVTVTYRKTP